MTFTRKCVTFLPSTWFLQFLFFLVVIFGAEVYASVELFRFYDEVPGYIHGRILKFTHDFHSASKKQLDNLQFEMQCCGSTNSTNWVNGIIPHTCFQKSITNNYTHYTIHNQECSEVLEEWTKENLLIIGWGGFSFSVVQVFGIVLSSCFYYTLRNEFG